MFTKEQKEALDKITRIANVKKQIDESFSELYPNVKDVKTLIDDYATLRKDDYDKTIERKSKELKSAAARLKEERKAHEDAISESYKAIKELSKEKSEGFPWLAKAYSDYFYLRDLALSNKLQAKKHPAKRAAEELRDMAKKRRLAQKQFKITKYILEYYESLFPWLVDFKGEDLDDLIRSYTEEPEIEDETYDQARKWLTKSEYEKLSVTERNQTALDRYWTKKKSKWEIGRDYERYVGYLYEKQGYEVYYQGIVEGLADLGRDLIAKKGKEIAVIQCKRWAKYKVIHEKHICQFKGTTLKYTIENPDKNIRGLFYTSTDLSDVARKFAEALDIEVKEDFPLEKYPSIKCNISRVSKEKIYHLPFDQQYDKTIIEEERNECYAETVAEAEKLGFRRAFRWCGDKAE